MGCTLTATKNCVQVETDWMPLNESSFEFRNNPNGQTGQPQRRSLASADSNSVEKATPYHLHQMEPANSVIEHRKSSNGITKYFDDTGCEIAEIWRR